MVATMSWWPISAARAEPVCGGAVTMRPVTFPVDGEFGTGRVYEPAACAGGEPRALILAVHGNGETASEAPDLMEGLARRTGAPVLTLDTRGGESVWKAGEFNLTAGAHDVIAAARWYRAEHPAIGRTVLWGWSQGGAVTGLALAQAPAGLFDYWVDNYGPSDLRALWSRANLLGLPVRAQLERDAGGCAPAVCPQPYLDRSLVTLAPTLEARHIVLVHGLYDFLIPYQASVDLRDALIAAGKPVSFYTVVTGRENHGIVLPGMHGIGPAWFQGMCAVERLLAGTEPLGGPVLEYRTDVLAGVDTAPAPSSACAV
ncbi:prolyl oligopeptidase family serine peptidase [Nocardia sp. 2]|uniref:Prolyl oligopeptidase family serine peptidase n=2 Tax=Nocardia acididurans TaxID=2802282 RepID=A0ABS1M0V1_9NOCA|nr:prolyl oligopeptidase family serine peptidase [Nocardia acididurans]